MRRWKKVLLVAVVVVLLVLIAAAHSRVGKMVAAFVLMPRIEARLEAELDATVLVGELDYRLWLAELVLLDVEAESQNGSWRMSVPEARCRISLLGSASVHVEEARVRARQEVVDAPSVPSHLKRLSLHAVSLHTPVGELSSLAGDLRLAEDELRGTVSGIDGSGRDVEAVLIWGERGVAIER